MNERVEPKKPRIAAILVHLPAIGLERLEGLIVDGWRRQAPRALVEKFDSSPAP